MEQKALVQLATSWVEPIELDWGEVNELSPIIRDTLSLNIAWFLLKCDLP